MSIVTVWKNLNTEAVQLAQLSDDPADGTPSEQIAHLSTLEIFQDYTCVSQNYAGTVPETDQANWRWDGTTITAITPIPKSISPRQIRLLLLQQGLLSQVETMVAGLDQASQIAWEFAIDFQRDDPLLNALGAQLGLTQEQIDQFYITAATL